MGLVASLRMIAPDLVETLSKSIGLLVGYTGDYGLPSGLQGYAEGGISLGPQVAPVSEGGHPELHLPLTPANVQQYLSGALAPQNGNGGEGDEVHIYIGTEEVTNMVLKRTMRRMKAKGAKFPS